MNPSTQGVRRSARALAPALASTLLAAQRAAHACSRVLRATLDHHAFVGRTQDWTERANSALRVYPRGTERTAAAAEIPRRWTSRYGTQDKRFAVMTNEPTYDKQIEKLKQYRTFGGDKPLPGERTPTDRLVRAAHYAGGPPNPASGTERAAYVFSVIRNVSVPFGLGDPDKPNVASTTFRTVIDLAGGRYDFESTHAPNVVWIDHSSIDFAKGTGERELPFNHQRLGQVVDSPFQRIEPRWSCQRLFTAAVQRASCIRAARALPELQWRGQWSKPTAPQGAPSVLRAT